jgi:hypothetical protein
MRIISVQQQIYNAAITGRAFGKSNVQGCNIGKEHEVKDVLLQPYKNIL